jgi:hypothetical protein
MPGDYNGRELAEQATRRRPGLRRRPEIVAIQICVGSSAA